MIMIVITVVVMLLELVAHNLPLNESLRQSNALMPMNGYYKVYKVLYK